MEWIRLFLIIVICGSLPLLLTLWLLSFVIKTPAIRILATLAIWAVILGSLSVHDVPRWRFQQFTSKRHLEQIYPALVAYKHDHENAFPEHLSQLVPDYIPLKDLNCFSDSPGLFRPITLTEVDRYGAFEYFGENGSGILAANRKPIETDRFGIGWKKLVRVVLEMDGHVSILPEREYQRRLATGMPKGSKTP